MGGNSFPETQRLSESEYTRMCQLITKYLTKIGVDHRIPVEVLDKAEICAVRGMTEPYGDVDVIVAQQNEVHCKSFALSESWLYLCSHVTPQSTLSNT